MSEFENLPLHDAIVESIDMNWASGQVEIALRAFSEKGKKAIPHLLRFENVKNILILHESPWGESVHINSISYEQGMYKIEMQSGDNIEILASRFSFEASAS